MRNSAQHSSAEVSLGHKNAGKATHCSCARRREIYTQNQPNGPERKFPTKIQGQMQGVEHKIFIVETFEDRFGALSLRVENA